MGSQVKLFFLYVIKRQDGFDDFILLDDTYTISYLIYGMASFPAQTDVSALVNPAGSTITGITVYDFAGGDFNKDGHGDLAFSDYADGSVKVIFGGATRFPSTIDFTTLLSTAKFTVTGFPSGSVILALNPAGDGTLALLISTTTRVNMHSHLHRSHSEQRRLRGLDCWFSHIYL